ncbi:hypothetical protein AN908_21710 [Mycobacteroides immunogenum]|uniref:Uncharacterized protein n=1 Tax=Mycobacteroides immunogenum TaxID=83262 RepID=A0A7V8LLU1_9MYCO|nr:hypothetical protein AN908_21710 [Mycobacteroides immunogenum]
MNARAVLDVVEPFDGGTKWSVLVQVASVAYGGAGALRNEVRRSRTWVGSDAIVSESAELRNLKWQN